MTEGICERCKAPLEMSRSGTVLEDGSFQPDCYRHSTEECFEALLSEIASLKLMVEKGKAALEQIIEFKSAHQKEHFSYPIQCIYDMYDVACRALYGEEG